MCRGIIIPVFLNGGAGFRPSTELTSRACTPKPLAVENNPMIPRGPSSDYFVPLNEAPLASKSKLLYRPKNGQRRALLRNRDSSGKFGYPYVAAECPTNHRLKKSACGYILDGGFGPQGLVSFWLPKSRRPPKAQRPIPLTP